MLRHFELVTFSPHNIKSQYFFLSRIVELLPNLSHLTISKVIHNTILADCTRNYQGEVALGAKGFKELVKGMTKSAGSLKVQKVALMCMYLFMYMYVSKVLTMKYLGIEETHVTKLAESRLTSDGLEYVQLIRN